MASCGVMKGGRKKHIPLEDGGAPFMGDDLGNNFNPLSMGGRRRITRRAHWRYIRGMKIRVPAKKVKDMGAKGKWASLHGPGIGELKPGGLMGYSPSLSKTARHTKLRKVVKSKGALSTFRKLNALATYTKRTAKGKSKTAKADRNWVKKTYMN